jgi:hypothetical protein
VVVVEKDTNFVVRTLASHKENLGVWRPYRRKHVGALLPTCG